MDATVIGNGNETFWSKWWRDVSRGPRIRQGNLTVRGRRAAFRAIPFRIVVSSSVRLLEMMGSQERWQFLAPLVGQVVVVDLKSSYVCLGTLANYDDWFLELRDADLHDFRDSTATRELYVYDSVRFGIRRNRARVLVRQDDVAAVTLFADVAES